MLSRKLLADLEKPEAEPRGPGYFEQKYTYSPQPALEELQDYRMYTYDRVLNPTHIVNE
jgi:hypothetical protein